MDVSVNISDDSPFSLQNINSNDKETLKFKSKSKDDLEFEISVASGSDLDTIKDFISHQYVEVTGYNEEVKQECLNELTDIFPEFYDENLWVQTKCWKCTKIDESLVLAAIGLHEYPNHKVYVSFFFVDKEYRDDGIGRVLWNLALDWLQKTAYLIPTPKYRTLHLITVSDIYVKAYNFYLKEGFKEVECELSSPYFRLVRMEAHIDF